MSFLSRLFFLYLFFLFLKILFKIRGFNKAVLSVWSIVLLQDIFFYGLFLFACVCVCVFMYTILNLLFFNVYLFFRMLLNLFRSFINKFILSFILNLMLFFYRLRFFFFFGSSSYDPLAKIFFDNFALLKGEFLMDFYNDSNKYLFENNLNVPLSIFSRVPLFDSAKNFFFVKALYNIFSEVISTQNKIRSFFFFKRKVRLSPEDSGLVKAKSTFAQDSTVQELQIVEGKAGISIFFSKYISNLLHFFIFDFFTLLDFFQYRLALGYESSIIYLFLLKYFTILKSCFIFILINLENDSFLHYLHVTLYRMALQQYYKRSDWENLVNTYDLSLLNSYAFNGDTRNDLIFSIKISCAYLFIYLNFFIFISISLVMFLFACLHYFFNFFTMLFFCRNYLTFEVVYFLRHFYTLFIFFNLYFLNKFFASYKYNVAVFQKIFSRFLNFSGFSTSVRNGLFLISKVCFYYFPKVLIVRLLFFLKFCWTIVYRLFFYDFFVFKDLVQSFKIGFIKRKKSVLSNFFVREYSPKSATKIFSGILFFFGHFGIQSAGKKGFNDLISRDSFFSSLFQYNEVFLLRRIFGLKFCLIHFDLSVFCKLFSVTILSRIFLYWYLFYLRLFSSLLFWNCKLFMSTEDFSSLFYLEDRIFYNKMFCRFKAFFLLNFYIERVFFVFPYVVSSFFFSFLNYNSFLRLFWWFKFVSHFFFFQVCLLASFFGRVVFFILFYGGFFLILFLCLFVVSFLFSFFVEFLILKILFILCIILLFYFFLSFVKLLSRSSVTTVPFFLFFYLFLKINFYFVYFYSRLLFFLSRRNKGFLEVLSILFLIRNDLKKYELVHCRGSFTLFNSLNTDFLVNNFLRKYYLDIVRFDSNEIRKKSAPIFDFKKFRKKCGPIKNLRRLSKVSAKVQSRFQRVKINNDLFPEFEYHKYLRVRDLRTLRLFRFRKAIEPVDFHFDSALDSLFEYKNDRPKVSNPDLLKIFYNNDILYYKDLKYFRAVFSRKNLSFFYDDLDKLSNFRGRYGKISFLYRYFYLKRERFKYVFSLFSFGNVNAYSFSVILNWILHYRILRSVILFFNKKDSSLLFRRPKLPQFQINFFMAFFDCLISTYNYLLMYFLVFFLLLLCGFSLSKFYPIFFILSLLWVWFSFARIKFLFAHSNFFSFALYKRPFFSSLKSGLSFLLVKFFCLGSFIPSKRWRYHLLFAGFQRIVFTSLGFFVRLFIGLIFFFCIIVSFIWYGHENLFFLFFCEDFDFINFLNNNEFNVFFYYEGGILFCYFISNVANPLKLLITLNLRGLFVVFILYILLYYLFILLLILCCRRPLNFPIDYFFFKLFIKFLNYLYHYRFVRILNFISKRKDNCLSPMRFIEELDLIVRVKKQEIVYLRSITCPRS